MSNNNEKKLAKCAHVRIVINGLEEWALLGTGSQITCISEDLYRRLNTRRNLDELPASKAYVVTAIGKKNNNNSETNSRGSKHQ